MGKYLEEYPDNLAGLTREEVRQELVKRLTGRVSQAWLFGSFLEDSFSRASDIDLILVVDTDKSFFNRLEDFPDLRDWLPALEPLVYTPAEFQKLTSQPSTGFWENVVKTMERLV